MKRVIVSIVALLFVGASVMANDVVKAKKVKPASCQNCKKDKCVKKAACPSKGKCCQK